MAPEQPTFRPLTALKAARQETLPGVRLDRVRRAGLEAREALFDSGSVLGLETCDLTTAPYPSRFAFNGAALSPAPFVLIRNRMNVVQFEDWEGIRRTLLFNPLDAERGRKAPFYARLAARAGDNAVTRQFNQVHQSVPEALATLGLAPEDVDYIAHDHLHIVDDRGWLGGDGSPPVFPRARLLVKREEWDTTRSIHPLQRPWYVPDGLVGIPEERVLFIEGDILLGKGVGILSTPGHTWGNMTLALVTGEEVFTISENGMAAEAYAPECSRIPGLRRYAREWDVEVILNANTLEGTIEQYTSMVLEKTVAGRSRRNPDFVNHCPSSELQQSWLAPGLAPTFSHGPLRYGTLLRPKATGTAPSAATDGRDPARRAAS